MGWHPDAAPCWRAQTSAMVDNVELFIELERGTDPLCGRATVGNDVQSFVGWLALLQVLQRAATLGHIGPPQGSE